MEVMKELFPSYGEVFEKTLQWREKSEGKKLSDEKLAQAVEIFHKQILGLQQEYLKKAEGLSGDENAPAGLIMRASAELRELERKQKEVFYRKFLGQATRDLIDQVADYFLEEELDGDSVEDIVDILPEGTVDVLLDDPDILDDVDRVTQEEREELESRSEWTHQILSSPVYGYGNKWSTEDFLRHADEDGSDVTLEQIGHHADIVDYYFYELDRYDAVNAQIIEKAREHDSGYFEYPFGKPYYFGNFVYAHGSSVVKGTFRGYVDKEAGMMNINGNVDYKFTDVFTDPFRLRDRGVNNSSDPEEVSRLWRRASDGNLKVFNITGDWQTRFSAEAYEDRSISLYTWS